MPASGANTYLSNIKTDRDLKRLFIQDWNWSQPPIADLYLELPDEIKNKIGAVKIIAEEADISVVLLDLNVEDPAKELKKIQRKIAGIKKIKDLLGKVLFIFRADDGNYLDFVKFEKFGERVQIKKFSINPENRLRLRTASEQLAKLKLQPERKDSVTINNQIIEAFNVEELSERFYNGYIEIFRKISRNLKKQKLDRPPEEPDKALLNYVHLILNRIMFLHYVQKKGCFNGNKEFLRYFWDEYKEKFDGKNRFHKEWLEILFFESLSQPSWLYQDKSHFSPETNRLLKFAPYLNGGLFEKNQLDDVGWLISDGLFEDIFEFFQGYNFTIEESTPMEIEIAINPEMLGNIYEHLVNAEEQEEQSRAGIFYTPRSEIELMVRRSLVEYLSNKTGIEKNILYKFVFLAYENSLSTLSSQQAEQILKELDEIIIVDPACGSGHYLVVIAQILDELKELIWELLKKPHQDKYEVKKQIIERNIYGVDIKEWALNIAKLRLWLELLVDADSEVLRREYEPLLPNLNFKLRVGDSLIQRIGPRLVPLRNIRGNIGKQSALLKELVQKKESVYKHGTPAEYKEAIGLEKRLLLDILSDMQESIRNEILDVKSSGRMVPGLEEAGRNRKIDIEKEIYYLKKRFEAISEIQNEIKEAKEPPFIWDLAFAEVFKMKNGFDIVIANPPYVRQESISDLTGFYDKSVYKEKLIEQMKLDWGYDFYGKPSISPLKDFKFDKRSDLYIYFYYKGLKLLNDKGGLCYISSNSWLDVNYGAKLQEILLKRVPIIAIYDNRAKRSFKHADINTIIVLLRSPILNDFDSQIKKNEVRFILFKVPFEEVMDYDTFIKIESNDGLETFLEGRKKETDIFRIVVINQLDLYKYGNDEETNKYEGNKWGNKYLRAPDIYWKILEKGKGKFLRLGDIADVRFGIKTGANEFFYLKPIETTVEQVAQIAESNPSVLIKVKNGAGWIGEIEAGFLRPVIKSPKEIRTILVRIIDLDYLIFMCNKSREELKGKSAMDYIVWGEMKGYQKKPTCVSRFPWWSLPNVEANTFMQMSFNEVFKFWYCDKKMNCDARLYAIALHKTSEAAFLNSTISVLFIEMNGRSNLGEGALDFKVYEAKKICFIEPKHCTVEQKVISEFFNRETLNIFEELGFDSNKRIRSQMPNPLRDRKLLDDVAFEELGLSQEERNELYWAVAEMVQNRLNKAKSV
mgnify:CR=1 FL=1